MLSRSTTITELMQTLDAARCLIAQSDGPLQEALSDVADQIEDAYNSVEEVGDSLSDLPDFDEYDE